ncbi:hypothetical protein [Maricaulis parjimensis]|uniref:hypothetical protein n=1 Tax=Maricaulis parjimensis TaxID=144023 RepID=UPI00193A36CB|nr:hypothetical protein [Maricaulis parjimensis]
MKHLVLTGSLLLALSSPVWADGMDNAVGHTVRVTVGDQYFDAWFAEDGSYSDSRGIAGTWSHDGELCIHVQTEQGPSSECGPWNSDLAAGESWSTTGWSPDGSSVTVEIIGH